MDTVTQVLFCTTNKHRRQTFQIIELVVVVVTPIDGSVQPVDTLDYLIFILGFLPCVDQDSSVGPHRSLVTWRCVVMMTE